LPKITSSKKAALEWALAIDVDIPFVTPHVSNKKFAQINSVR
jgi:hypothetical protein